MTRGWMELHYEKLHNLYFSPDIISDETKDYEIDRACSMHRAYEKCIQKFGLEAQREETVQ
jgi:hypothetical protein